MSMTADIFLLFAIGPLPEPNSDSNPNASPLRLFVRHAVNGAQSPNQITAIDADHLPAGKALLQDVDGLLVSRTAVGGDEDYGVGDVEVGVTGGQALAVEIHRLGHGELHDVQRLSVETGHGFEEFVVLLKNLVVLVLRVVLDGDHHGVFVDEAGHVIDVAVGVVARDAVAEPEHLFDAEVAHELRLDLFFAQRGIAIGIEQAGCGGEQETRAVDVDRAPFEHHAGRDHRQPLNRRHALRHGVVVVVRLILAAPGVILPVHDNFITSPILRADDVVRAVVAAPGVVGRNPVEDDALGVFAFGVALPEQRPRLCFHRIVEHVDVDGLGAAELIREFSKDCRNRLELARPRF